MVKNLPAIQETWIKSLGREDPLEKGMATNSSILALRIPWTEEPGGLQSMEYSKELDTTEQLHWEIIICFNYLGIVLIWHCKYLQKNSSYWIQSICAKSQRRKGTSPVLFCFVLFCFFLFCTSSPLRSQNLLLVSFASSQMKVKVKVKVAQSCLTLYNPMGFSRPEYWSG